MTEDVSLVFEGRGFFGIMTFPINKSAIGCFCFSVCPLTSSSSSDSFLDTEVHKPSYHTFFLLCRSAAATVLPTESRSTPDELTLCRHLRRVSLQSDRSVILPEQSGSCPVHVPLVVQCLVVRPEVLNPSQHAYATELPKVMPSLKTILPWAGVPGFPQDTAGER